MARRTLILGAVGLIGALIAVLAWQLSASGRGVAPTGASLIPAGERPRAPDFTLQTLNGDQVSLDDLRGSYVLLNFWASWCAPCRLEAPILAGISRPDLRVVGVNVSDFRGDAADFIGRYGIRFLVLRDGESRVAGLYGVAALPETFLIDGAGRVAARLTGPVDEDALAAVFDALAAAPSET